MVADLPLHDAHLRRPRSRRRAPDALVLGRRGHSHERADARRPPGHRLAAGGRAQRAEPARGDRRGRGSRHGAGRHRRARSGSVVSVPGRFERVEAGQPFLVVVDYAHTPDALERTLETARKLVAPRRPARGGLRLRRRSGPRQAAPHGRHRRAARRPRLDHLRQSAERVARGDHRRHRGGHPGQESRIAVDRHETIPDRKAAIQRALDWARAGDVVVIAGKGHETYQIVGSEVLPFDDRAQARAALAGESDIGPRMPAFTIEDIVRGTRGALLGGDLGIAVAGISIDSRSLGVGEAFFAIRGEAPRRSRLSPRCRRPRRRLPRRFDAVPDDLPSGVPVVLVDDTTVALGRLGAWHRPALRDSRRGGDRLERQDHDQGDDGCGAGGARARAQARVELQQPVGPAADAAQAHRRAPRSGARARHQPARRDRRAGGHRAADHRRRHDRVLRTHRVPGLARRDPAGEERAGPGHSSRRRRRSERRRSACPRHERRQAARASGPSARGVRRTSARRVRSRTRRAGCRLHPRDLRGPAGGEAALSPAGTTSRTRSRRRASARRSGCRSSRSPSGLEAARPVKGRCVWRPAGSLRILDDTYNANPVSVRAALETLVASAGDARRVVVLGDMLELGPIADAEHQRDGPRRRRIGSGRVRRAGRAAGSPSRRRARRGSRRATTRRPSRTPWRIS